VQYVLYHVGVVIDGWCRTLYKACANSWSTHICGEVHFMLF